MISKYKSILSDYQSILSKYKSVLLFSKYKPRSSWCVFLCRWIFPLAYLPPRYVKSRKASSNSRTAARNFAYGLFWYNFLNFGTARRAGVSCPKLLSHHLRRFFTKSINRKLGFHLPSKQDSSFKIAIWNSPAVPETKTTSNLAVAKCRAHVSPAKIGAQLCYHHESWIHLRTCFSRQDQPAWWNCSPAKNSWETADDDVRFPVHGRQKHPLSTGGTHRVTRKETCSSPASVSWQNWRSIREKRPGVPSPKLLQECTFCKASPPEKTLWDRLCVVTTFGIMRQNPLLVLHVPTNRWQFGKYP